MNIFKVPSIDEIFEKALTALKRFPLTLLLSVIVSIYGVFRITNSEVSDLADKVMMVLVLGIPLFFSVSLISERRKLKAGHELIMIAVVAVLMLFYFLLLPNSFDSIGNYHFQRYAIIILCTVLLLMAAPFVIHADEWAFWYYNQQLILRFILVNIYTHILYGGIALILLTINVLFNAGIEGQFFFQIWVIVVGIIAMWLCLGGIPQDLNQYESSRFYNTHFEKNLAQYVVIPLLAVYGAILIIYAILMIITQSIPKNMLALMTSGYMVVGVMTYMVVYIAREDKEKPIILLFTKFFFYSCFPMVALLVYAVGLRISDYGITEARYYLLVFALWMVGISLYFIISKQKRISWIPLSLVMIGLITSIGPWSSFTVSKESQIARFNGLLTQHAFVKDKILQKPKDIEHHVQDSLSSIANYLEDTHGNISSGFHSPDGTESLSYTDVAYYISGDAKLVGFPDKKRDIEFGRNGRVFDISGFDISIPNLSLSQTHTESFPYKNQLIEVKTNNKEHLISLSYGNKLIDIDYAPFLFNHLLKEASGSYNQVSPEQMAVGFENDHVKGMINFSSVAFVKKNGTYDINYFNYDLYMKLR